jgi:hypothetical protein
VVVLVAGCSASNDHSPANHASRQAPPSTSVRPNTSAVLPADALHVSGWGVVDGLLSVLVENTGTTQIASAHTVITALDTHGAIIATVSGADGSLCCTIIGLQPHATFGIYADFGPAVTRTASVTVNYSAVQTRPASDGAQASSITASDPQLASVSGVTVVRARLGASASAGPYVAVQATLRSPDGRLVAVISGRFYCLFPGNGLGVTLQLFHPVPAGTVVQQVNAFPIPSNLSAVTGGLPSCTTSATG